MRAADSQEAGAAAQATIAMLRAELADSHRAESAAQEASFKAASDLADAQARCLTSMCPWCRAARAARVPCAAALSARSAAA